MQTPKMLFFHFFTSLLLLLNYHSSQKKLGNHGITAALQVFPFVVATNGSFYTWLRKRAFVRVSLWDSTAQ